MWRRTGGRGTFTAARTGGVFDIEPGFHDHVRGRRMEGVARGERQAAERSCCCCGSGDAGASGSGAEERGWQGGVSSEGQHG